MHSLARTLTGTAVALAGVTALALGAASPALAAGNNVVNAHCGDIVLDLKDNPHEHDSRGEVTVTVNGRTVFTGPVDTADFHRVLDDLGDIDGGYEWTVSVAHPYTGDQLFRTSGAVQCQSRPTTPPTEEPTHEPIEVEVPFPELPVPQPVLATTTTYIIDVPKPELPIPVVPEPTETHTVVVKPPMVIEPPAVIPPPVTEGSGTPEAIPAEPTDTTTPHEPDSGIGAPVVIDVTGTDVTTTEGTTTEVTTAELTTTDDGRGTSTAAPTVADRAALPNLGGPDLALAGLAGSLVLGGTALVLLGRRRTTRA
jgi:hypothetical protein